MNKEEQKERERLGQRIRESREYLGYSQEQVSGALGIPRTALSLIESGGRKLDALELKRLARLLERPSSFFTDETQIPNPEPRAEMVALARTAGTLNPEDLAELERFAEYLKARGQAKREIKNG